MKPLLIVALLCASLSAHAADTPRTVRRLLDIFENGSEDLQVRLNAGRHLATENGDNVLVVRAFLNIIKRNESYEILALLFDYANGLYASTEELGERAMDLVDTHMFVDNLVYGGEVRRVVTLPGVNSKVRAFAITLVGNSNLPLLRFQILFSQIATRDPSSVVRAAALKALYRKGASEALLKNVLMHALERDAGLEVKSAAIAILTEKGWTKERDVSSELVRVFSDNFTLLKRNPALHYYVTQVNVQLALALSLDASELDERGFLQSLPSQPAGDDQSMIDTVIDEIDEAKSRSRCRNTWSLED